MSLLDYQQGAAAGAAGIRRVNAAIDQWEAHSNRLEDKLRAATQNAEELAKQKLFAQAQLEGQKALVQELQRELGRLGSNSALAQEANAKKIRLSAMSTFLKKHGYDYDTKTEMVRKI